MKSTDAALSATHPEPTADLPHFSTAFIEPRHFTVPAPWAGHLPFAAWLVATARPRRFVELGVYSGISYLTFCQAISAQQLACEAFGVDTWQGDAHAGHYGEHIYRQISAAHDPHYLGFSRLMRMTFDEALGGFQDGSVDLLHIDGLHTYEAVRHDFETWCPKLSARGVVLFHDTNVYRDDFGVHQLWKELRQRYAGFHFGHSNGLGVLLVGAEQPQALRQLSDAEHFARVRPLFEQLGARWQGREALLAAEQQIRDAQVRWEHTEASRRQQDAWIEQLNSQILDLSQAKARNTSSIEALATALAERDNSVATLRGHYQALDQHVSTLNAALAHERGELERLQQLQQSTNQSLAEAQAEIIQAQQALRAEKEQARLNYERGLQEQQRLLDVHAEQRQQIDHLHLSVAQLSASDQTHQAQLRAVLSSRSWRFSRPLRAAGAIARAAGLGVPVRSVLKSMRALARWAKGDLAGFSGHWSASPASVDHAAAEVEPTAVAYAGIITTPHTAFIAQAIARTCAALGWRVDIHTAPPADFPADLYFVLCAQMFDSLPTGHKRICFQLEQSVSDRWFTTEYLSTLESSRAVLDYSMVNLRYLAERGIVYPHTFYAPIGALTGLEVRAPIDAADPGFDVLFYGDDACVRRQTLLTALRAEFRLRVENNLFGPALDALIHKAKVVVNLHYYEGALLETARLAQAVSLGAHLVSERAVDMTEQAHWAQVVDFVEIGDAPSLVAAVRSALLAHSDPLQRAARATQRVEWVKQSEAQFDFHLRRMLLALDICDASSLPAAGSQSLNLVDGVCVLGMPETTRRRDAWAEAASGPNAPQTASKWPIFPGVRKLPGWLGCAMSYQYLAKAALERNMSRLEVAEDDVVFLPGYRMRRAQVDAWLTENPKSWDIFAGLIAIVHPDTRVLDVQDLDGITLVTVDRMISMVHNIYAPRALHALSDWDATWHDSEHNTIDKHLQRVSGLRVVTTVPFLASHRADAQSTLWGIRNTHYDPLIAQAELDLTRLAAVWRLAHLESESGAI